MAPLLTSSPLSFVATPWMKITLKDLIKAQRFSLHRSFLSKLPSSPSLVDQEEVGPKVLLPWGQP